MGLQELLELTEKVGTVDERRRVTFREEFEAFEAGDRDRFEETRALLADERRLLGEVAAELEAERNELDDLMGYADFLSVDQAVRNRDEVRQKLNAHNDHLESFREAMETALDRVETNLDAVEVGDPPSADPEPAFRDARDAIEAHNKAVDGLQANLTILNAYLI
jgi:chromosome segregation ATPase